MRFVFIDFLLKNPIDNGGKSLFFQPGPWGLALNLSVAGFLFRYNILKSAYSSAMQPF